MAILCYKEKDGTLNALVSGKVTRDPVIKSNRSGNYVSFSVAYGKKKYMTVEAWQDNPVGAVAENLERGEVVMVTGSYRSWEYDGKEYSALTADMITNALPKYDAAAGSTSGSYGNEFEDLDGDDDELPF